MEKEGMKERKNEKKIRTMFSENEKEQKQFMF